MLGPRLWAGVPYGNSTAFSDFCGTLELWFHALGQQIHSLTGVSVAALPIGSGFGSPAWMLSVQQMFADACDALGIARPPDLADYDLRNQDDFTAWMFTVSQQGERLRVASGLP